MTDEIITAEEMELPQQETEAESAMSEPAENGTVTVVDIQFRTGNKVYFFDPGELKIRTGDHVIMDTARGTEFGYCAGGNHPVSASDIVPPLRKILRIATEKDEKINEENILKEKKAYDVCQQKIQEHGLDMQLVSAECAFDGSKILFFFTADGRVDFRELVKNLASVFRTRIELRQIGVRDKAKMVGGLGICGRPFCCKEFLDDFQPVSIKMAKTQNLSLNPTKISGTCGRLMCCLKYEQEAYEDLLKTSPKSESFVDTVDGRGTVVDVNLLRQSVRVRMEDQPDTINCYKNCDICVLRNGKAKKNDLPIPRELAPISSKPKPERKFVELSDDPMPDILIGGQSAVGPVASMEPAEERPEKTESSTHSRRRRKKKPTAAQPAAQTGGHVQEKLQEKIQKEHHKQEKPHRDRAKQEKLRSAKGEKVSHGSGEKTAAKTDKAAPAKNEKHPSGDGQPKEGSAGRRHRRRRPHSGQKPGGTAKET